jgi:6-phosphofructo-2-kinase/fructose-2,6-biphosphatase 4
MRIRDAPLTTQLIRAVVFFCSPGDKSPETQKLRSSIKEGLEQQALDFFQKEGGQVVIYDANNGVRATRYALREKFEALGIHVVFLGTSASQPVS